MADFDSVANKMLGESAFVIDMTPIRFEVKIACDYSHEAPYLASYIEDGQVGYMDVVEVNREARYVILEVEAEGEQEARLRIKGLLRKAGLYESATITEVSPPGFSGTTKALKRHKEIDNPYALSWAMWKKGYKPHYPPESSAKGRKTYVKPSEYKPKSRSNSVQEATTTASIPDLPFPWLSPPLYGIKFSKEEQEEVLDHISRMYPQFTREQLRKSIWGDKESG